MSIISWQKHTPVLGNKVWVAPSAEVIGRVEIGEESSVWFGCLIRGDVDIIKIGKFTNIQDHCVIHVSANKYPTYIGDYCTLGHKVLLHGCTLKDFSFVGMGAIVLDGAELGEYSILGAGSLLPSGRKIPPRKLAIGTPARVIREITKDEEDMIRNRPLEYAKLKDTYLLEK